MNQDHKPNDKFEDRLLAELRARVARREEEAGAEFSSRGPGRRVPRIALAGAAVTAAAAAVLVIGAGGGDTPAAYAVTPHGDGSVSVEVRRLSDPEGLEQALDAVGVPAEVTYPTEGESCDLSRLRPAGAEAVEAVPAEAVPVETVPAEAAEVAGGKGKDTVARLTVYPQKVGDGRTLVVVAAPAPDGEGDAVEATVAASGAAPCGVSTKPAEAVPAEPVPAETAAPAEASSGPTKPEAAR